MLVLFTDTDTDMTPELAEKYGYHLISMPYSIDGNTVYPYEDFDIFDPHAFYQTLREGTIPNTGAISKQRYIDYFEPYFAAGDDILYVHFSRAMSASFDNMDEAYKELKAKYPERTLYTVDTKGITIISLNIALEVADLYKEGKTAEEILKWAKTEVDHFAVYFFADDLKFFKHSGRVSGLAGTMGTLLGIRPIIYMDAEGKMVSIGKEKGRAKASERVLKYVEELGDDVRGHRVIVGNTDAPELVSDIIEKLKERYGEDIDVLVSDVNPTTGAHCGPSAAGICFHSKHR